MSKISTIKAELNKTNATLVAVTKTRSIPDIMKLYDAGHRIFGENRVQELVTKFEEMPKDIEWHLIGHLQKNKVKYIAPFVKLIHSVDSIELAEMINKQAAKHKRVIDILLQLKVAAEESKFGLKYEELNEMVGNVKSLEHVRVVGIMGMATFTSDQDQVKQEFKQLRSHFESIKNNHFKEDEIFTELSMGMSGDYKLAIEEGSTMVRIGSLLFSYP